MFATELTNTGIVKKIIIWLYLQLPHLHPELSVLYASCHSSLAHHPSLFETNFMFVTSYLTLTVQCVC